MKVVGVTPQHLMPYELQSLDGVYKFHAFEESLELIQEKEQPMTTKFKAGDRVKFNSLIWKVQGTGMITAVDKECTANPPLLYGVREDYGNKRWWCREDEVELIQPEAEEPVPGKFYRTNAGKKVLCVGKDKYGAFIYQEETDNFEQHLLIVGEWVDEVVLPAVEVKQWAVVQREDKRIEYGYDGGHTDEGFKDFKRGDIIKCSSDKEYLKRHLKADEEIVELTGTLPEYKA